MLTSETKQKINNCRDYLVWKIPDPKWQIDQITNALIYKFMSDQDKLATELWGKATFFVDQWIEWEKGFEEYEKYSWENLFDSTLTNDKKAKLYIAWIEQLSKAKHLPELFRDIFKDAFLPFRDSNTIVLFLTEINKFNYHNSEELWNAFEYLLSIMWSQWNAWQFRTPRHIIDFLVDVVAPKPWETIYDPACGTAGFLISAYKHIIANNPKLSVAEKLELAKNISWVDIDPWMAKIARVNLYLHWFKTPKISEDDTLSNYNLWENKYDVILANPPFMTPKWGIKVHEWYSIKSTKAEVLFTDYIAEHLKLKWRAWIIVPEWIIFQSANAYKDLRKMIIEDNLLYAVVSLPSWVFNPYSWVKTSILFFDRDLAKKSDKILFLKVENDWYDLWAQRRPIWYEYKSDEVKIHIDEKFKSAFGIDSDYIIWEKFKDKVEYTVNWKKHDFSIFNKNDLPTANYIIKVFDNMIKLWNIDENFNKFLEIWKYNNNALLVDKSKISENWEYNLSAERYRETKISNSDYEMVELWEKIKTISANLKIQKSDFLENWEIPIIDQSQKFISWYTNNQEAKIIIDKPLVIFGDHTCSIKYIDFNFAQWADWIKILKTSDDLSPKFLYYNLLYKPLESDWYKRHFTKLKLYKIPLPPLDIQEQIVEELGSYQKIIDWAKQIVENYKPQIKIESDWEIKKLKSIVEIKTWKLNANKMVENWKYPFFTCSKWIYKIDSYSFDQEALLLSWNNASWNYDVKYYNWKFDAYQRTYIMSIINLKLALYPYIKFILESKLLELKNKSVWGLTKYLTLWVIQDLDIPLPDLEVQKEIVARIEEEQKLVESSKKLIEIFEWKIKEKIGEVWGENDLNDKD